MKQTLIDGLKAGLQTTYNLGKIIFPVTFIVVLLQHTPVLPWITELIAPFMGLFGLSGEAAVPLVLGNFLNLYAGIAGILSLEMTVKEVFIIAVMLSFSHNLLIETGVALKVGVKLWVVLVVRLGLAFVSAIVINLVWSGGQEIAQYGMMPEQPGELSSWGAIILMAFEKAAFGILQLAIIVIPLMVIIQIMRDKGWMDLFSKWMAPITRGLGMKENTSMTLVAGLTIGLAYGAGVMIKAVQEDGVSKKDATLAFIFLVSCHAVVEDTLIFIPLGIPILPLFLIRITTAIVLTIIVAYVWRKSELSKERKIPYEQSS